MNPLGKAGEGGGAFQYQFKVLISHCQDKQQQIEHTSLWLVLMAVPLLVGSGGFQNLERGGKKNHIDHNLYMLLLII